MSFPPLASEGPSVVGDVFSKVSNDLGVTLGDEVISGVWVAIVVEVVSSSHKRNS